MRYSQIRAFHNVALYGGFSRAAEEIAQTQPALSEQVRRLEQDHDVLLFVRDKKGVRLTETGERLFRLSKQFFESEQQIEEYLTESAAGIEGRLRIIADSAHHITSILGYFRERYPNVYITLRSGNTTEIVEELRAYNAEIGVVGSLPKSNEFEVIDLGTTPIYAISQKGYLPKDATSLSLEDLRTKPLVFRELGSKTRQKLSDAAASKGVQLKPAIEVEGREAMREVVAAGAGIGFVSEAEFGNDTRLERIPLRNLSLDMQESILCMSARGDVRVIRAFMDVARNTV